ncbi:hypothetical protein DDB_G0287785 [Dictyostelium discoideum AX4]|uniref:Uncharacterized protein n=1 Tax=Dictyostelium discoideum TaxID=44689 RepID=Q54JU9_DICDI|nr:hypothetical protein DDB_G0287785 [Dictyostelium discoideum AX4]EAL63539.1 hypothetical protein DDB_G0287785 [Dictyostelium discoideum AX4]|eukprot:XP_637053.1 hypothetical protein DDB_G0287785 [Dictyostelium discoideum AX4]
MFSVYIVSFAQALGVNIAALPIILFYQVFKFHPHVGWDYNHRCRIFGFIVANWGSSILAILFFVYLTQ